jgi:hypothetical protein
MHLVIYLTCTKLGISKLSYNNKKAVLKTSQKNHLKNQLQKIKHNKFHLNLFFLKNRFYFPFMI